MQENENIVMLRLPDVMKKTRLSRAAIYGKSNPKSKLFDERFPMPIKLGAKASGWIEHEVNEWLKSRITASHAMRLGNQKG